jgi:ribose transport system substrate-binding protein
MRKLVHCALIPAMALSLASIGAITTSHNSMAAPVAAKHGPPYTIDLSNTSVNNGWRLEMQSVARLFATTPKYSKLVKFRVVNAPNDVSSQIQSLNAMIAQHVDAILIDADSPTALNPVIDRATRQGIVVVSFDSLARDANSYSIGVDLKKAAYTTALWLAKSMHGKGNLVINNGIMGTDGEALQNSGVKQALRQFPKIKVVAEFSGQWATAPSEAGMARLIATHPKIDGVWNSGGELGVIQALQNAHRKLIPIAGFPFNKYLQLCVKLKSHGLQCGAASNPTTMSAMALQEAISVLQGKKVPKSTLLKYDLYTNNGVGSDVPATAIIEGKTTFRNLPDEFSFPFTLSGGNWNAQKVASGMH